MAVKQPQYDNNNIRGGSDLWDNGLAGEIITADYFEQPPVGGGQIKVWNGSAWVAKPVKAWNGSTWQVKPVKFWSGSAWVTTGY